MTLEGISFYRAKPVILPILKEVCADQQDEIPFTQLKINRNEKEDILNLVAKSVIETSL